MDSGPATCLRTFCQPEGQGRGKTLMGRNSEVQTDLLLTVGAFKGPGARIFREESYAGISDR